jgi:hypothetical protein
MISWNDIAAECGNYKSGFVAVFRKYEGQSTDEHDAYGRVVKVTQASFARHIGIDPSTFGRWVKQEMGGTLQSISGREERTAASHANVIKNMARKNPAALLDAIESAGVGASDQVFHEHKLRRAGIDTSKAARKAAEAAAHHQTEPIRRAMATADVALCVAALRDATEHLRTAIEAGALDGDAITEIAAAHEDFQIAMAEASLRVP